MDTYFRFLFDAIINKRVIEIVYYPFVIGSMHYHNPFASLEVIL